MNVLYIVVYYYVGANVWLYHLIKITYIDPLNKITQIIIVFIIEQKGFFVLKRFIVPIFWLAIVTSSVFGGNKAPDFTLKKMSGGSFTLNENLNNGPILLDFWATWCKPCLKALPEVQRIHEKYAENGLQVVTISTDNPKSSRKVKPFVKGARYTFEVLLDSDQEVRKLFGGTVIPLSMLISSEGEIVYRHIGYKSGDESELETKIRQLLNLTTTLESETTVE